MSYGVFSGERRRGWGTKLVRTGVDFVFDVLNLRRIECEVLKTNVFSQRCVEKAGFKQEGIKRKAVFRMSEEIDSIVYGLLRSER